MKRIVVVGFGYGGLGLLGKLDRRKHELVVVEPKDHFFHHIGSLRSVVEEGWYEKVCFPLPELGSSSRFVKDRVVGVTDEGVTLESGDVLEADAVVLGTGSTHARITPEGFEGKAAWDELRGRVGSAKSILFVGAGAIGLELAGEIRYAHPNVAITLVDRSLSLMSGFKPSFGANLARQTRALNMTLKLGVGVSALPSSGEPFEGQVGDEEIAVDLAFATIGAKPSTGAYASSLGAAIDERGYVKVGRDLRVEGMRSVFAYGDITNIDEPKTAISATGHVSTLAKNLRAHLEGRPLPKAYTPPSTVPLMVPLGPKDGSTHMPMFGGVVIGPFMTKLKGKELFTNRFAGQVRKLAA